MKHQSSNSDWSSLYVHNLHVGKPWLERLYHNPRLMFTHLNRNSLGDKLPMFYSLSNKWNWRVEDIHGKTLWMFHCVGKRKKIDNASRMIIICSSLLAYINMNKLSQCTPVRVVMHKWLTQEDNPSGLASRHDLSLVQLKIHTWILSIYLYIYIYIYIYLSI